MKKSLFGLFILFIFLTNFNPKSNLILNSYLNNQKIKIENNFIIGEDLIKKKLNFLYSENLLFLNAEDVEENLKSESFIESFSIKKIYPNTIKLIIVEKKPIAILQNKKKNFLFLIKED